MGPKKGKKGKVDEKPVEEGDDAILAPAEEPSEPEPPADSADDKGKKKGKGKGKKENVVEGEGDEKPTEEVVEEPTEEKPKPDKKGKKGKATKSEESEGGTVSEVGGEPPSDAAEDVSVKSDKKGKKGKKGKDDASTVDENRSKHDVPSTVPSSEGKKGKGKLKKKVSMVEKALVQAVSTLGLVSDVPEPPPEEEQNQMLFESAPTSAQTSGINIAMVEPLPSQPEDDDEYEEVEIELEPIKTPERPKETPAEAKTPVVETKKKKGKKGKEQEEVSSLDKWIIMMAEKAKLEPPKVLTPEELAAQREARKAAKKEKAKAPPMSKEEKKKLKAQQEAEWRKEQVVLYAQWKLDEIERIEKERIAFEKRELREYLEMGTRIHQLRDSYERFNQMSSDALDAEIKVYEDNEWNLFITCCKLPYPVICQDVNAYITYWRQSQSQTTIEQAITRTDEVMYLLQCLEHQIKIPLNATPNQIREWKLITPQLKQLLQKDLDYASYFILREVQLNMSMEDVKTATYYIDTKHFTLNIWTKVPTPIPAWNPFQTAEPPTVVRFEDSAIVIEFPQNMDTTCLSLRALRLKYDHLSYRNQYAADPKCPEEFMCKLYEYNEREWIVKQRIKFSRRVREPVLDERGREVPFPPDEYLDDDDPQWSERILYDRSITPVPSEIIDDTESKLCDDVTARMAVDEVDQVINLRRYNIVGGTLFLNLMYQPPQPKRLMMNAAITALELPKQLKSVPYYEPPPNLEADASTYVTGKDLEMTRSHTMTKSTLFYDESSNLLKTYSNILQQPTDEFKKVSQMIQSLTEAAIKRQLSKVQQEKTPEEIEQELWDAYRLRLIKLQVALPQGVAWFEKPILCFWHNKKRLWMTNYIFDYETDSNMTTATFKANQFGVFAFAVNRYLNFPFVNWKMSPAVKSKDVIFTLETPLIELDITIRERAFAVTRMRGIDRLMFKGIYNVFMNIDDLVQKLRAAGLNIFPTFDSFCYIDKSCQKHWVMERHLYMCMAAVAPAYKFRPSKWNTDAGPRVLYLRVKESTTRKWFIAMMTHMRVIFIDCKEADEELNTTPMKGLKFAADLYQLCKDTGSSIAKKKLADAPCTIHQSVLELLTALRVMSFTYIKAVEEEVVAEADADTNPEHDQVEG